MDPTPLDQLHSSLARIRRRRERNRRRHLLSLAQQPAAPVALNVPASPGYFNPHAKIEVPGSVYGPSETGGSLGGPESAVPETEYEEEEGIPPTLCSQALSLAGYTPANSLATTVRVQSPPPNAFASQGYGAAGSEVANIREGNNEDHENALTPRQHSPESERSGRSWASGSLTTSVRAMIGLPPLPLRGGRVRPVPEPSGPSPPRFPCYYTTTLHTCGHSFLTTDHQSLCLHDDVTDLALPSKAPTGWVRPCPEKSEKIKTVDGQCERCGRPPTRRSRTEQWLKERQETRRPKPAVIGEGELPRLGIGRY